MGGPFVKVSQNNGSSAPAFGVQQQPASVPPGYIHVNAFPYHHYLGHHQQYQQQFQQQQLSGYVPYGCGYGYGYGAYPNPFYYPYQPFAAAPRRERVITTELSEILISLELEEYGFNFASRHVLSLEDVMKFTLDTDMRDDLLIPIVPVRKIIERAKMILEAKTRSTQPSGFGNSLPTQGSTRSAPQFATLASSVPVSRFGRPPVVHSGNSAPSATENPFAASPSSGSFAATADDLSNVASISMGSRAENFSQLGVVSMSKSVSKMSGSKVGVITKTADDLCIAAEQGNVFEVHDILDYNPSVLDKPASWGWTALIYAAAYGHTGVARVLLVRGADLTLMGTSNNDRRDALGWANARGHTAIVELIEKEKVWRRRKNWMMFSTMFKDSLRTSTAPIDSSLEIVYNALAMDEITRLIAKML